MSSAAHWLVLSAVASRERVLSTWETEHLARKHAHSTHRFTGFLHSQKKKCTCWFRHIYSRVLTTSFLKLELRFCPSAGHYVPSPHFLALSFPFLYQCHLSCVGGEVASILDSLKETRGNLTSFSLNTSAKFVCQPLLSKDISVLCGVR